MGAVNRENPFILEIQGEKVLFKYLEVGLQNDLIDQTCGGTGNSQLMRCFDLVNNPAERTLSLYIYNYYTSASYKKQAESVDCEEDVRVSGL